MPTVLSRVFDLYARDPDGRFARCWNATGEPLDLTYGDLIRGASSLARRLEGAGVGDGDVVVVIGRREAILMTAWIAPQLLGAVPTLLPWPTPKVDKEFYARSITSLLKVCEARVVIISGRLLEEIRRITDALDGCRFVLVDDVPAGGDVLTPPRAVLDDEDRITVLQHSSGSTGLQKGIALSSKAIFNQLAAHGEAINLSATDRYANWMPLYHDAGLVGGFLQPLVNGLPLSILSPMTWVSRPALLLEAITRDRCTVCWMANFAYNFMARMVPDSALVGVDLSSMRAFVNTAEPVRVASHAAFLERFGPYGLDPLALTTSYAAAENTLAITQSDPGRPVTVDVVDRHALEHEGRVVPRSPGDGSVAVLSSGRPLRNVELRVVDPDFREVAERRVGELVLRSDCTLSEYHRRPDLTSQAFHDGWYLTGDYGYVAGGEVFVTGRKKDLIIVGGQNLYPQDLEFIADGVDGVHPGRTAAFGVENEALGTEDIVLVVEAEPGTDTAAVARAVTREVARQADCFVRHVHVVPPMWLVKTTSGKISRVRCKEKFLRETQLPAPEPAARELVPSAADGAWASLRRGLDVITGHLGPAFLIPLQSWEPLFVDLLPAAGL